MSTVIEPPVAPANPRNEKETLALLRATVSPSRLTLFLSCRLKFFFRHVQGITKPKTAALHVGSAVHAVLRKWNMARWKGQPLTLKELHDEFSMAWATEEPVRWEEG